MTDDRLIEYQRLVEDIRSDLVSSDRVDLDMHRELTALYAEAVEEVNGRLRACQNLLKKGLRSDAIESGETSPHVLDSVEILEFPEKDDWTQQLAAWNLVSPPDLLLAVAEDLNRAYAEEQPLKALLKTHRLLALGRAPLPARMGILRQLKEQDPTNPVWETDLASMEQVRLKQLANEINRAYQQQELEHLNALIHELTEQAWLTPPPPSLKTQAVRYRDQVAAAQARHEMQNLGAQLHEAHSAFDVNRGRRLLQEWQALTPVARLSDDDPLLAQAAPALEWLDDEDRETQATEKHRDATAALTRLLDANADRAELENAYHRVLMLDRGVDELIEHRYRQKIDALDLASGRKTRLIVVSSAVVFLALASLIGFLVYRSAWERTIAKHADQLNDFLKADNLGGFGSYQEKLEDRVKSAPEISGLLERWRSGLAEEKQRSEQFTRFALRLETAGPEEPDLDALRRARELAKLPDETQFLDDFERGMRAIEMQRMEERRQVFQRDYEQLQQELLRMEEVEGKSLAEWKAMSAEVDAFLARRGLPAQFKAPAESLAARIDLRMEETRHQQALQQAKQELDASVGGPRAFLAAVEELRREFPDEAMSVDLQYASEETAVHVSLQEWHKVANDLTWEKLPTLSPVQARSFHDTLQTLVRDHPAPASVEQMDARLEALSGIMARRGSQGVNRLIGVYSQRAINNLWVVQTNDGTRYYSPGTIDLGSLPVNAVGRIVVEVYTGLDFSTRQKSIVKKDIVYSGFAPQSALAEKHLKDLRRLTTDGGSSWENTFLSMIDDIQKAEHLDPILHVLLLKNCIQVACEGSFLCERHLKPLREHLDAIPRELYSIDFIDPDNETSNGFRRELAVQIRTLPSPEGAATAIQKDLKTLTAPPDVPRCQWVAWLSHESGGWRCRPEIAPGNRYAVAVKEADVIRLVPLRVGPSSRVVGTDGDTSLRTGRFVYQISDR